MSLMKSLCLVRYGFNLKKNLKFFEREIPSPKSNDVLIAVNAAGINPVDYKIAYGMARLFLNPKRPFPLGFDLAGVVIAKGDNVRNFNIGDEVYSKVPWEQMGTISTHSLVREDMVSLKPKNISFNEAAGLPLASCTVYDALKISDVKKGSKILIIGGSGGTGSFAIQYAKYLGAYVIALTSTRNVDLVQELGADEVLDYTKTDFSSSLRNVDIVFDTVGGRYPSRSVGVVKKGGKIITIAGHHDDETLKGINLGPFVRFLFKIKGAPLIYKLRKKEIFYKHVWSYPNKESLDYIRSLVEAGRITPISDREFAFENAVDALKYVESRRARGKVTVTIRKSTLD